MDGIASEGQLSLVTGINQVKVLRENGKP